MGAHHGIADHNMFGGKRCTIRDCWNEIIIRAQWSERYSKESRCAMTGDALL